MQNKINIYLGSIENGSLYENYPKAKAKGKNIVINIIAKYPPNKDGEIFIERAKETIESANFKFSFYVRNGE